MKLFKVILGYELVVLAESEAEALELARHGINYGEYPCPYCG